MEKYKSNLLIVYIIVILITTNLTYGSARYVFSVENKDLYGILNNYQKDINNRIAKAVNNSYTVHSYSTNEPTKVIVTPLPILEETSIWPSGTMTRKHFEIINMLWRKTKIFLDTTDFTILPMSTPTWYNNTITTRSTRITEKKKSAIFFTRPPVITTTTPSKIEFYYINDDNNVPNKEEKYSFASKVTINNDLSHHVENLKNSNKSFLVFHIRGPIINSLNKRKSDPTTRFNKNVFLNKSATSSYSTFLFTNTPPSFKIVGSARNKLKNDISDGYYSTTDSVRIYFEKTSITSPNKSQETTTNKYHYKQFDFNTKTTVYDKIKFFEIYDRMTPVTSSNYEVEYNEDTNTKQQKDDEKDQRTLLINVDQSSHEHNQSKPSKKHIREDEQSNIFSTEILTTEGGLRKNKIIKLKDEIKHDTLMKKTLETDKKINKFDVVNSFINRTVKWSEYPFTAVYIYEPSQIRCDAAAISAHWLIASGACLSRLNKNPNGGGRSAYVVYCGAEWWKPERVSYVKYSVVHPSFHPTEKPRKYLYNIGLVQVVTSMMSACSGWSPVTLMSHQFTTSQEGTVASALGWGLDRFDTRYSSMSLPKSPLTLYNALLFSHSCPGNLEFSEGKIYDDGGVPKNLYCLALPPYSGEETDPVHGGLLLVGSNLIAMYLQEERRPWGEQSAQYTGIWRLIPWIMDIAKEAEDIETSFIEI